MIILYFKSTNECIDNVGPYRFYDFDKKNLLNKHISYGKKADIIIDYLTVKN